MRYPLRKTPKTISSLKSVTTSPTKHESSFRSEKLSASTSKKVGKSIEVLSLHSKLSFHVYPPSFSTLINTSFIMSQSIVSAIDDSSEQKTCHRQNVDSIVSHFGYERSAFLCCEEKEKNGCQVTASSYGMPVKCVHVSVGLV